MREKPILFSAPMVRAILDGGKTQTRRVVNPQPVRVRDTTMLQWRDGLFQPEKLPTNSAILNHCPYGQPGDRLWVRETWMPDAPRDGSWPDASFYGSKCSPLSMIPEVYRKSEHCLFRSTWDLDGPDLVGWKPSIHMPRWASRITLEVTGVRVERLQEISEADAQAEGVSAKHTDDARYSARDAYAVLWESINGGGSWDANHWVWVIEFKRTK